MINICMYGCRSCNFSCAYCMGPEKNNKNEKFILDKEQLRRAISYYRENCVKKSKGFAIWGGEPLLHFAELVETISFLNDNFPKERIMVSTNGFLLKTPKIRHFIQEKRLKLQLSVDGVAQKIRSEFNPLENEIVSSFLAKLAKSGLLTINCVMHQQNYSVNKNIDYFTKWMKTYDCLESNLNIRFTPFNESDLTPAFNLTGEHLYTFLNEFEALYIKALLGKSTDLVYKHFSIYPLKTVKKSNFEKIDWSDFNQCSKFYTNKSNISKHIDTKGKFISCNLIDSGTEPRGKTLKKIPEYCNGCEFYSMRGCFPCPSADFTEKCEWKKAWMQFQQRMLLLNKLLRKK
ncbi:radical SAM protein [Treponema zioleckii]|uniref:radical SAM protein n=1 Tax=Treponema zioleckii TaxID=331680 RepID=UPI0030EB3658